MNRLDTDIRARMVSCLVEGTGVRPTARIVNVSINAVQRLIREIGPKCKRLHDERVRGLSCQKIQADEAWAFTYCRQKNVGRAKMAPAWSGDTWVWTAMCSTTKIVPAWVIGARNVRYGRVLIRDLASRITGPFEMNTDGLKAYGAALGFTPWPVDHAQVIKVYATPSGTWNDRENRYQAPALKSIRKERVWGNPDTENASTSFVERMNLGLRMQNQKLRRLTNGFAKRLEMLQHSMAIYYTFYNFCRPHQSLGGQTPAQVQGLTDRRWSVADLVTLSEENRG